MLMASLRTTIRKVLLGVVAVLIVVLITAAVVVGVHGAMRAAHDRRQLQPALEYMASAVEATIGYTPKDREEVTEAFFTLYSRTHWRTNEIGNKHHPDAQFLMRLPDNIPQVPRSFLVRWRTRPLYDYIEQQTLGLLNAVGKPTDVSNISLVDRLKLCSERCRYQLWWEKDGANKLEVLGLDSPALDEKRLQAFYQLFCKDSQPPAWQVVTAKLILGDLRRWRVGGLSDADCEHRPYLVFACYFRLLSQKHFKTDELKLDCYASRFVLRLPDKPISLDGKFASEKELAQALEKLLTSMSHQKPAQDLRKVLEQIRQELNYDVWLTGFSKLLRTSEEDKTTINLKNFVGRFSSEKN